ncbi:MAG: cobyrinate a,c-diamide synthase [Solirubrobacterales bacterium]
MIPRIVIAAPASGNGKTTVATGLVAQLAQRGLRPAAFKVGPDFIDPSYHRLACGRPGRNLDVFMSGEELIAPLFRHGAAGAEIAVIEGVMGLFDGRHGGDDFASTAQVARLLDAPVVLVVDARAMAGSVAALVSGFARFDHRVRVGGVVLNRVGSDTHEEMLRTALRPVGVPVIGALRRDETLLAPERHLGLVPAAERGRLTRGIVDRWAEVVGAACDLEALIRIARTAGALAGVPWRPAEALRGSEPEPAGDPVRIALAAGPAFSFRYEENLELLRAAGGEPLEFDPLTDALPDAAEALLLGGGFPEVFAGELGEARGLRASVRALADAGRPVIAECGGLLFLCHELDGHPMCGVIEASARMTERLTLGYREAEAACDSAIAAPGWRLRGHEFHYSVVEPAAATPAWRFEVGGRSRAEGFVRGGVHASYLHTHWASTPEVAGRLVASGRSARGALVGGAA